MRRLLFLIILIFSLSLSAQELQVIVPVQIDRAVTETDKRTEVEFYEMAYTSDSINVKSLKRIYKNLDIPDYIKINSPDLTGFNDTMILLAAIDKQESENDLIIWLAGNYKTNKVTFFIDRTLDRNFNNDGKPIIIKSNQGNVRVEFKPRGKKLRSSVFLAVPKKSELSPAMQEIRLTKRRERILDQFSLELMAGVGVGKLNYNFNNTQTGFPFWYDVKFSAKNLGMMFNYDTNSLRIGLGLQYFNLFYFTSYANRQYAALNIDYSAQELLRSVETIRNQEIQPTNLLQYSLMLAYKIRVSEMTSLQPNIVSGFTHYLPSKFYPNRTETQNEFKFANKIFVELGIRAEFVVGKDKAVFLGFAVNGFDWTPNGFVESLPQENYESSLGIVRGTFGYRVGF